jgi:phosphoribosyl 1,2-cyclic phosphate phosphodiesterase
MKLRLLGSGTSSGVPRIGNDWGRCDPDEQRNWRTRASVLVWTKTTRILVDTSPDMREQLLAADVSDVDAVIWTHEHADHTHGIDDLRQLYHARRAPVKALARPWVLESLRQRFAYAFEGHNGYPPMVAAEPLPDRLRIGDIDIAVVDQPHGPITSAGLRFEANGRSIGYSTDFNMMTPEMDVQFEGVELWVVDTLRREPHPTHPTLEQVIQWSARIGAKHSVLMHMDQSMDYRTLLAELPPRMEPGYDGWESGA